MIMNTCSADLDLSMGAVSKSILQGAGRAIQDEVLQFSPGGLQAGQAVVSSGGNLNCQQIIHAVLSKWDSGNGPALQVLV